MIAVDQVLDGTGEQGNKHYLITTLLWTESFLYFPSQSIQSNIIYSIKNILMLKHQIVEKLAWQIK